MFSKTGSSARARRLWPAAVLLGLPLHGCGATGRTGDRPGAAAARRRSRRAASQAPAPAAAPQPGAAESARIQSRQPEAARLAARARRVPRAHRGLPEPRLHRRARRRLRAEPRALQRDGHTEQAPVVPGQRPGCARRRQDRRTDHGAVPRAVRPAHRVCGRRLGHGAGGRAASAGRSSPSASSASSATWRG